MRVSLAFLFAAVDTVALGRLLFLYVEDFKARK